VKVSRSNWCRCRGFGLGLNLSLSVKRFDSKSRGQNCGPHFNLETGAVLVGFEAKISVSSLPRSWSQGFGLGLIVGRKLWSRCCKVSVVYLVVRWLLCGGKPVSGAADNRTRPARPVHQGPSSTSLCCNITHRRITTSDWRRRTIMNTRRPPTSLFALPRTLLTLAYYSGYQCLDKILFVSCWFLLLF